MTNAKLIKGRWVLTGDEVLADAAVAIEGSRIIETGSATALSRRYDGAEVIGSEHSAVLPGFVNAHHHSHGVSTIQHGCADALLESWILGFAGIAQGPGLRGNTAQRRQPVAKRRHQCGRRA